MGDWQPIETAPRDGREILGFNAVSAATCNSTGMTVAYFQCDGDGGGWWVWEYILDPTHWCPFPDPPTTNLAEESK